MRTAAEHDELMTTPTPALVEHLATLHGDVLVLGASGKLGPSLVRLAVRAIDEAGTGATVTAVSRFSTPGSADEFVRAGARVIPCDITDEDALAALPDASNVVYLVGAKFGSADNPGATWLTNTYLPGRVAARFPTSRIVALSTGNVYPLATPESGGCDETAEPGPVGEYAMSCLGRERVLQGMCARHDTPLALIRLNYACEGRYGVLVDLARQIMADQPVDVSTAWVNVVWQGYCNEVVLRSLGHADVPPFTLNLTGPEVLRTRELAEGLARRLGREVSFVGVEQPTALLSDASRCHELFGSPSIDAEGLLDLTADWISQGNPLLDKPTKFQRRDGKF